MKKIEKNQIWVAKQTGKEVIIKGTGTYLITYMYLLNNKRERGNESYFRHCFEFKS